jgi:hypothetical protein
MRWEARGCDKFISPAWEDAMLYPADERNRRLSSGRRLTSSRHRWRSEQVVWQGKRPVPYNNRHSRLTVPIATVVRPIVPVAPIVYPQRPRVFENVAICFEFLRQTGVPFRRII